MLKKNIDSKIAEESLISSLIYKPDKITDVIDLINPSIFSVKEFGNIYKCIVELYKDDIQPDEVTIVNKGCMLGLEIMPELVKKLANGRTFVTKKQLKNYCEIIKTNAFKRKTLQLCDEFVEKAKDMTSPEKIINDFFSLAIDLSDKARVTNNVSAIDINSKDILNNLEDRYNNPCTITGIPFGFSTVDKYLDGAEDNDIITIGGQNSHGKSYFAQQTMINMALWLLKNNIKKKILFISLEMTREQIEKRLLSIITGINAKYFKNPKLYFIDKRIEDTPENFEKFKENIKNAVEFLNKLPIIIDDSSCLSAEQIAGEIKKYILKDGLATVFIDYVGLVQNEENEEYLNISHTYRVMKQIAKDSKVPIIILNQYLKDFKNRDKTGYKPMMSDMTGGKSAMNDSHKIIHIWKPDKYESFVKDHPEYIGKIVVFSDKNRSGCYGDMPEVLLTFDNGQLKESNEIRQRMQDTIDKVFVGVQS